MGNYATLELVERIICRHFRIKPLELFYRTRKREYIEKRQIFHYLAREYTNSEKVSLEEIGQFGGCNYDHATVLHSIKVVNNLSETDKRYKKIIDQLNKKILDVIQLSNEDLEALKTDIEDIKTRVGMFNTRNELNQFLNSKIVFDG